MKGFRGATLASLAAAALLAATPMLAHAVPVMMHTAGTNYGDVKWSGVGLDFDVNAGSGIRVLELGVFDDGPDGISGAVTLSTIIFDAATQTPLIQMDFAAGDAGMWTANEYLFKPLASPLLLGPGRYTIVSYGFDENNRLHNGTLDAPNPVFDGGGAISFYQCRWGEGADLPGVYPIHWSGPSGGDYLDAPNMIFEAVPAPGATVLGAIGLSVVGCLRRRRIL